MATRTRTGPYTFADFLEVVQEDQKADLIDGVIYMASPETIEHNQLAGWFYMILTHLIEERGLGLVTINKVAYRLSKATAPEPDVAVVLVERQEIIKSGYVDGPPDLAIEIVSPESVDRDYADKRRKYEEAGVKEYIIIIQQEPQTTFLVNGPDGFVEVFPENHIYRSRAIPDFEFDVRWLWKRPLPPTLPIVQALLARTRIASADEDGGKH